MVRFSPALLNLGLGVIIGLTLAVFIFPGGDRSSINYNYVRSPLNRGHAHHHDAHNDEEVDDSDAPSQAMHFHGGGNTSLHHAGMSSSIYCSRFS